MSGHALHPASDEESSKLWPVVDTADLFDSRDRFDRFRAEAPWRVQVTDSGEAAVVERWRSHLDVLAIRGLWCSGERVPVLVGQLERVARQQGFSYLLSPLVATDAAPSYERADMTPCCTIVIFRYDHSAASCGEVRPPAGVRLRLAVRQDTDGLMLIERECFDAFWRYDTERLTSHLAEDRIAVAENGHGVIGYTLATVVGGSASIGRLAVRPSQRRRGVGGALLAEAIAYLLRAGVSDVSVCTQEENHAALSLYRGAGLKESPGRFVFLISPTQTKDTI